uniref:CCHC-type domain-containing protein n=1 Tax=Phytophthora ramorum TaxID=164328 RepID=H3GKA3_PHYRM
MVSLLGEAAFAGFPNLPAEQQRSRVERFDKYESSLIAHVSTAAQEAARTAMRAEAQSVAQANPSGPASYAARQGTTKPVRMSVPTFDGKEADSLVFWIREIEIALSAGQIYESRAQVAFALSNLGGRARAWAMARETSSPGYFTSWAFMEQELRSTFLLANVAYRYRSLFLRCKQGKRTLQDYVMELQNLEAAMAGAPLSEDVKVTVFMDGVRPGPVRTELFRRQPTTFNDAVHITMLEDHCVRSAQGYAGRTEATEDPTPMEISSAESARPQRNQRASGRCFGCNQLGHFRRNCPTNPWKTGRGKAAPSLNVIESAVSENGDSQ